MPDIVRSLGLDIPNVLGPLAPAGRLIWSSLLLAIGTVGAFVLIRRPKRSAEPATWAATIAGAIVVWALMILAYGVVPHEWLTFANAELNWGKDTYFLREGQFLGGRFPPFDVPRFVGADIVAATMYVVFGVLNVYLFSAWQKRKVAEPATAGEGEEPAPPVTGGFARLRRRRAGVSAYGRPVTTSE
ncbi:MAG: hypothetical protein KatS3mg009_0235 [Acidimicrobiia bacterium]|nr:MAG: hypothetical protein KatS3mg009_0235 [Acidimicrobiia bacterium]